MVEVVTELRGDVDAPLDVLLLQTVDAGDAVGELRGVLAGAQTEDLVTNVSDEAVSVHEAPRGIAADPADAQVEALDVLVDVRVLRLHPDDLDVAAVDL